MGAPPYRGAHMKPPGIPPRPPGGFAIPRAGIVTPPPLPSPGRMAPRPTKPEPEPDPTPAPEPDKPPDSEPSWVTDLKGSLDRFGQRIDALAVTLTDDDKRGIAEGVHELFERAGAFIREPANDEPDDKPGEGSPEDRQPPESDKPPDKQTLAERIGFPKW